MAIDFFPLIWTKQFVNFETKIENAYKQEFVLSIKNNIIKYIKQNRTLSGSLQSSVRYIPGSLQPDSTV